VHKLKLQKESFLGGLAKTINNVSIKEIMDHRITSLAIPLTNENKCAFQFKRIFNKLIPDIEKSLIISKGNVIFRLAADMLFLCENSNKKMPKATIDFLKRSFYSTDQSGGWCCLQVSGNNVLRMLERICPLDLSEERFKTLDVKRTSMEHLGVIIFKKSPKEFFLYSASSSSKSFLHAVETSCKNL
jgi:heterotetrameric sarcosine oxidase gamma subunit